MGAQPPAAGHSLCEDLTSYCFGRRGETTRLCQLRSSHCSPAAPLWSLLGHLHGGHCPLPPTASPSLAVPFCLPSVCPAGCGSEGEDLLQSVLGAEHVSACPRAQATSLSDPQTRVHENGWRTGGNADPQISRVFFSFVGM